MYGRTEIKTSIAKNVMKEVIMLEDDDKEGKVQIAKLGQEVIRMEKENKLFGRGT